MLSINNQITIEAYNRGYRINDNGVLINKTGMPLKGFVTNTKRTPYRMSTMRMNGKNVNFYHHKLCAYQKFGAKTFKADCVRHLNNDSLDNSPSNIALGSIKDNYYDIPLESRANTAKKIAAMSRWASKAKEIIEFHKQVRSYKETMKKFGISSGGTLYYILKKKKYI